MTKQDMRSWLLNPACLIDRLLDQIEKLSSALLPAQIDDPSYREAPVEPRLERIGS